MSSIQQVMDGLSTVIDAAAGLRCYSYVPEDLNPPAVFLSLGEIERGAFKMGQMELRIDAALFVSRASDRAGQKQMNTFATWGTTASVWKAVDDTPGLGLADTNAAVLRFRPFGIDEVAAYGYFGGVFEILVLTAGAT